MEQELAFRLQDDRIHYQTQVEIPVTTADFYFLLEPRPLLVFVDGRVHRGTAQMIKDEELRSLLRKKGYRNPRAMLRRLLGQEKRPAIGGNTQHPGKGIISNQLRILYW